MRKVKFRGFYPYWELYDDMKSGWIYGYLGKDLGRGEYFIQSIGEGQGYGEGFEVLKETIGQYTGLKDKNGNEIYEGDILKRTVHLYMYGTDLDECIDEYLLVEYREEYAGFFVGERPLYDYIDTTTDVWTGCRCTKPVVVGNIYENPELLEVK